MKENPPQLSSPNDIFGCLPCEVLLALLKHLNSLSSLWSLINASPICSAHFDSYAVEIMEAVMLTSVPPTIQHIMRATLRCQIQAPGRQHQSLAEVRSTAKDIDANRRRAQHLVISMPLTSYATELEWLQRTKLPRRFLLQAHKIHVLAHACTDHYITASLAIRPRSLVKIGPRTHVYRDRFEAAESLPYQPQESGPASWVEEHRVIKTLWLIQYFFELQLARAEDRLGWPAEDLAYLQRADLNTFFALQGFEEQQLLTVLDFLQERAYASDKQELRWLQKYQLPVGCFENTFAISCALPLCFGPREDHYQQGSDFLDKSPMAIIFQLLMARNPNMSPLPGMPFDPYRKFGFAIFDDRRMTDLGLAEADKRAVANFIEYHYRWFSILTREERDLSNMS